MSVPPHSPSLGSLARPDAGWFLSFYPSAGEAGGSFQASWRKTFSTWHNQVFQPGHYLWTSPHGHQFHVGPAGTTPLDGY